MDAREFSEWVRLGIFTRSGTPGPWQDRGRCRETDPEAYFPEPGENSRYAKRVCAECDVRKECLVFALLHRERFGVWGGASERERRELEPPQPFGADTFAQVPEPTVRVRQPNQRRGFRSFRDLDRAATVLAMAAKGTPPAEIAEEVGLATDSVRRILRKSERQREAAAA